MKLLKYLGNNILFFITLFLLAFIPLYPKLPLVDIRNTWVYIRAEDFVVLSVLFLWVIFLIRRKATLKTPLTLPIMLFWFIGALATLHGILIIFPTLANVFPNVAFLSFIRHIEYMSLFFMAYTGMNDKRFVPIVVAVLTITLLLVVGYGFGQKYAGFNAYLTMNEEFAKGVPIQLSSQSRVPSTFAGHYDLAAYLVLILPLLVSMIFGFKKWLVKGILTISVLLGVALLFMTISRVSFFVLFIAIFVVLFFQKKRFVLYSLPFIALLGLAFFMLKPALLQRFNNTVKEVNVLVDAKTGDAVGNVTYQPSSYFKDKQIVQTRVRDKEQLASAIVGKLDETQEASPAGRLFYEFLPPEVPLVTAANVSTGETLPQGTGYINLSLSPVTKRLGNFFYEYPPKANSTMSAEVVVIHGDFIVKRASAYDLSFTTRFQGEWPNAINAFMRNILLGSGYGSVSLAVDNNYLRMLGEIGFLGIASFFVIFLGLGIYIRKVLPDIESPVARSFIVGILGGIIGIALNATLIDVFEASKIAFLLWMLMGITMGVIMLYQKKPIDLMKELKRAAISPYAVIIYILIAILVIFSAMINNYFVGDDFTWFRWAAECTQSTASYCTSSFNTIIHYFTQSDGFFYRPGTKSYFYAMYSLFWLNQTVYHMVSLAIHFLVVVLFYFLANKVLKNKLLAVLACFLFLIMSGYTEIVFWIAASGHLFNALFVLLSIICFILWIDTKKIYLYVATLIFMMISMLFHELGIVTPLALLLYASLYGESKSIKKILLSPLYLLLFVPDVIYLLMRFISHSHWFNGDYSYNLIKLPFNFIGNMIGYALLTFVGPMSLSIYEKLRMILRDNLPVAAIVAAGMIALAYVVYKYVFRKIPKNDRRVVLFCIGFFIIFLLPFLGLGNITSRYSYLASFGLVMILVLGIQKLYEYLLNNGKSIALSSIAVGLSVFSLFHIIQVQQLQMDWHGAGDRAQHFFTSIDALYSDSWSRDPLDLHFVNVPIKNGDAWIFPVGLEDALWFAFQNPQLSIFKESDLDQAFRDIRPGVQSRVLQFNEDGSVNEVVLMKKGNTLVPTVIQ